MAFFDPVDPIGEYDETIRRRIELHPELSLMLAVLEAAVSSFQKHVSARDHKGRRIFREVEEWILDDRNAEIFSFVSICEHLGINPKYLRQGLLRWKQNRLAEQGSEPPASPAHNPFSAKTSAIPVAEGEEKQQQARAKPEPEAGPDALTLYLQEVASIPRLTYEGESDLIKQMREGQEELVEEVLSSPTALRYTVALIDKLRKAEPDETRAVLEAEGEIDPQEFFTRAIVLCRLAAAHDRIVSKLSDVSLPGQRQERLETNLLKIKADIFKALKNLRPSGSCIQEIAVKLKKSCALLTELEKKAQALSGIDRSSLLSEISAIERGLELPMEEIKRRVRSITESEAKISSARKELIEAHLYLVVRVARKFSRLGLQLLDLIQDGNIGLLRAAEKFDPRLGLRFATYAWWWIRLFVRQGAIESARIIRVPAAVMEQWRKLGQTRRNLFRKLGREPVLREVAAEMGKPLDEVLRIVSAMRKPVSLETPVGAEGHLGQFFENKRGPQPFEMATEAEVRAHVAKALAALPPREEAVLRARFGIGEAHEHTLEEVARRYSVTRERVRQIEHRAFGRLRLTAQRTGVRPS